VTAPELKPWACEHCGLVAPVLADEPGLNVTALRVKGWHLYEGYNFTRTAIIRKAICPEGARDRQAPRVSSSGPKRKKQKTI